MKKPQWITLILGIGLVAALYYFGKTTPPKKSISPSIENINEASAFNTDSILIAAKKQLNPTQVTWTNTLENSISRGDVKDQKINVYHQLAHFWGDSMGIFEPYAWYSAEAARLENSEKTLTFAARLFLDNLQSDDNASRRKWKALQSKDLFERSLRLNPENDSAKVGLGACYLFGNISATPMEGILKIREVTERDSSNLYAQMMLVKGSLISGQYDKAIIRLLTIHRLHPENAEAVLILADTYDRTGDKANAIEWYKKSMTYINRQDVKAEIGKRIEELKK
ncbi:MAG: tetratricopeptide repeat protein [Bacteroidota bacterium]